MALPGRFDPNDIGPIPQDNFDARYYGDFSGPGMQPPRITPQDDFRSRWGPFPSSTTPQSIDQQFQLEDLQQGTQPSPLGPPGPIPEPANPWDRGRPLQVAGSSSTDQLFGGAGRWIENGGWLDADNPIIGGGRGALPANTGTTPTPTEPFDFMAPDAPPFTAAPRRDTFEDRFPGPNEQMQPFDPNPGTGGPHVPGLRGTPRGGDGQTQLDPIPWMNTTGMDEMSAGSRVMSPSGRMRNEPVTGPDGSQYYYPEPNERGAPPDPRTDFERSGGIGGLFRGFADSMVSGWGGGNAAQAEAPNEVVRGRWPQADELGGHQPETFAPDPHNAYPQYMTMRGGWDPDEGAVWPPYAAAAPDITLPGYEPDAGFPRQGAGTSRLGLPTGQPDAQASTPDSADIFGPPVGGSGNRFRLGHTGLQDTQHGFLPNEDTVWPNGGFTPNNDPVDPVPSLPQGDYMPNFRTFGDFAPDPNEPPRTNFAGRFQGTGSAAPSMDYSMPQLGPGGFGDPGGVDLPSRRSSMLNAGGDTPEPASFDDTWWQGSPSSMPSTDYSLPNYNPSGGFQDNFSARFGNWSPSASPQAPVTIDEPYQPFSSPDQWSPSHYAPSGGGYNYANPGGGSYNPGANWQGPGGQGAVYDPAAAVAGGGTGYQSPELTGGGGVTQNSVPVPPGGYGSPFRGGTTGDQAAGYSYGALSGTTTANIPTTWAEPVHYTSHPPITPGYSYNSTGNLIPSGPPIVYSGPVYNANSGSSYNPNTGVWTY